MWIYNSPDNGATLSFDRTPEGFRVSLDGGPVTLDTEDAMSLVAALAQRLALVAHE